MHCEVYNWKLSVMRQLYTDFPELLNLAESMGFDKVWSVTPNPKFCEMYGAMYMARFGHNYIMYWDTKET